MSSQEEGVHQMPGEPRSRARAAEQDTHRRAQVAQGVVLQGRRRGQSLRVARAGRPTSNSFVVIFFYSPVEYHSEMLNSVADYLADSNTHTKTKTKHE